MASREKKIKNQMALHDALQHSIGIEDLQPISSDDDRNESRVTLGDRAGNRVWSGSDLDLTL